MGATDQGSVAPERDNKVSLADLIRTDGFGPYETGGLSFRTHKNTALLQEGRRVLGRLDGVDAMRIDK
jgi:hypothetical protein